MNLWKRSIPILKAADDGGFVLCPVLVPEVVDEQGDVISAEEIEKAAHDFMESYQTVGLMHERPLAKRDANVVENYIQRAPTQINGRDLPAGTWMMGVRLRSEALRQAVRDGTLTGLSIGGRAEEREEETA